jgi:type II secretory pathway pseudopilin PulG
MMRLLKFLLIYKLKGSQPSQKTDGFTLIELLVGLLLAFLVLTPLLGFMVNLLNTERQEQAKTASEQEIQAALSYIARDLDQSVFIYDAIGLRQIATQLPQVDQVLTNSTGVPVLVFWKRKFLPKALPVNPTGTNCATPDSCDDAFVFSLVAYYLIKDNCATSKWSCTARIGRVELRDELRNKSGGSRVQEQNPSPGFQRFNLSPPAGPLASLSLEQKMNAWTNTGADINTNEIVTLIDYIDQTPQNQPGAGVPKAECPTDGRPLPRPDAEDLEDTPYPYRQVPAYTSTGPVPLDVVPPEFQTSSFYACVSTDKTLAQVVIRGNALARTRSKTNPPTYIASQSAFFPRASIQVQGRGLINDAQSNQ